MIFVTVGTQLPFDRLIRAIDNLAAKLSLQVLAQTGRGNYLPQNITTKTNIDPVEFENILIAADVIISHAGIGTVLAARKARKPLILMPRRAALGEHRNDHQLATVSQLEGRPGIYVARSEQELECLFNSDLKPPMPDNLQTSGADHLRAYLRHYLHERAS